MHKEVFTYKNFDGEEVTETFWFNITKTEIMTNYVLQDKIEQCNKLAQGDMRELTAVEKQFLVDTVKDIMKLAYGERKGQRHIKTEEAYENFRYSAAYDEFLFSLFTNDPRATTFISQVLPQDFKEEVAKAQARRENVGSDATSAQPVLENSTPDVPLEGRDYDPTWVTEGREPTNEEWSHATSEQIQRAFKNRQK